MSLARDIENISHIAYSYKMTVWNTYDITKKCIDDGIPGVFVECGVGAGAQIAAMQLANQGSREIYAFDSFEGIPLAGVHDDSQPGIGKINHDPALPILDRLVSSGITSHSVDNVKKNITRLGYSINNITFIKGWFQDTIPKNDIKEIAVLRLDGDLYESTLICLQYLYPKVTKGGFVIIDDYSLPGARKAFEDYKKSDLWIEYTLTIPLNKVPPDANGVVWFQKQDDV